MLIARARQRIEGQYREVLRCVEVVVDHGFRGRRSALRFHRRHAEYVAMVDILKEVLLLRQVWYFMLPELGSMLCITVFEDNEGTVQLARNPITNSNSKHIDVKHNFIRELVAGKYISINCVASEYQHENFFTKALVRTHLSFTAILK